MDPIWLGVIVAFFAGAALLVRLFDRLHREG